MNWITQLQYIFSRKYYNYLNKRWYNNEDDSILTDSGESKIYRTNLRMVKDVRNWAIVIAVIVFGSIFTISEPLQILGLASFGVLCLFFAIYGCAAIYREKIILSPQTISHCPPIGKTKTVLWSEIEKVRYDSTSKHLVLHPKGSGFFSCVIISMSYPKVKEILNGIDKLLPSTVGREGINQARVGRERLQKGS